MSSEVRYFFNATSGQCQQFEYAEGCSGNGNNFETMQECQDTCRELARTVTSWCSLSSINLSIHLSINLPIHLSINLPIHLSINLPIHLSINLPIHPSTYPSIHPCIHQRTLYSMCPFIYSYPSKHPCMQAHTYVTSPPPPSPTPFRPCSVLQAVCCPVTRDPVKHTCQCTSTTPPPAGVRCLCMEGARATITGSPLWSCVNKLVVGCC